MKHLVTDPQEVERLAEELEDENWEFRVWIRNHYGFDDPKLNGMVWRLAGGLMEQIDCTSGKWQLPAPCPLLEGNLCRVYGNRPEACRQYPHLHNDFRASSISRFNNTFICPIVFNLFELMKEELNWRPRSQRRRRRR
ncbi:MAG: YkgJ family cysteine cluster protein [Candidatus Diapherotrites archaeon]|nr:YkgJ family cysteine cluster protein [Candidatus Diapherotrites archaeon]